jgi:hypothetical protein
VVPLALQAAVNVVDVAQVAAPLGRCRPRLYQLQHLVLHVAIRRSAAGGLHEGGHVVEELARSYLLDEVGAAVLDAGIGELAEISMDHGS